MFGLGWGGGGEVVILSGKPLIFITPGMYECQISTTPHISRLIYLSIKGDNLT